MAEDKNIRRRHKELWKDRQAKRSRVQRKIDRRAAKQRKRARHETDE
ncbi:hypothetical protein LCGC14_1485810 [marine sediment metagenome]|uniref:Uncharacterized protein n=1 Tax=marine sediment metagenome TaxID=412755 RepID=A0A0F9J857_9ZZZZ